MKQHVHRIAATCFFHLRRLRQIRRRIGRDLTVRLILIDATIHQNAAARLVFELRGCEHVTPSLIQLHWLPVRWRIYFKLCTIMHAVHTGRCPAYLKQIVHTVSSTTARPGLRSAVSTDYVVPRLRTKFGERAFSYAGPVVWNSLPGHE